MLGRICIIENCQNEQLSNSRYCASCYKEHKRENTRKHYARKGKGVGTCSVCGKVYIKRNQNQKFCTECYDKIKHATASTKCTAPYHRTTDHCSEHRTLAKKLNLITDCMRAGGLADGEYDLGGQNVTVKGIQCRLADGTIAGSVLTLNKAVYNVSKHGVPLHEAVNAASLYPAMTLGIENERGAIRVGLKADMVICDKEMNVKQVIKNGKTVYYVTLKTGE